MNKIFSNLTIIIIGNQKPAEAGFWKTANNSIGLGLLCIKRSRLENIVKSPLKTVDGTGLAPAGLRIASLGQDYPPPTARILYQKLVILIIVMVIVIFGAPRAQAASPQFMFSWRAESYAPSWYAGKVLPTKGSVINAAFELIDNGKPADLKKTIVRWYLNDNLVRNEDNGLGITSLRFTTNDYPGNETEVRISLPSYNNQALDKIFHIPVVRPEVVIKESGGDASVAKGQTSFEAVPFFFNIRELGNLIFKWTAANQETQGGSDTPWDFSLNIPSDVPSGTSFDIGVTAQNSANDLEIGNGLRTVIVK